MQEILRIELQDLIDLDFDIELTGFETGEIDVLVDDKDAAGDDADDVCPEYDRSPSITRPGDCWRLGDHVLVCGDARENHAYQHLLGGERAVYVITDPPYNVKIGGHVSGLGRVRHREFAMASGEMNEAGFADFIGQVFRQIRGYTVDGAIAAVFMDWRHMAEMLAAGQKTFAELKNLCVSVKPNGGMGSSIAHVTSLRSSGNAVRASTSTILNLVNMVDRAPTFGSTPAPILSNAVACRSWKAIPR